MRSTRAWWQRRIGIVVEFIEPSFKLALLQILAAVELSHSNGKHGTLSLDAKTLFIVGVVSGHIVDFRNVRHGVSLPPTQAHFHQDRA